MGKLTEGPGGEIVGKNLCLVSPPRISSLIEPTPQCPSTMPGVPIAFTVYARAGKCTSLGLGPVGDIYQCKQSVVYFIPWQVMRAV